jgi:hypothetical protein
MAISNYSELQIAVADWLHDDILTPKVPDFITLGEVTLNRRLRLMQQEEVATINTSIVNRFGTLPSDFLELIDLALYSDNSPQTLTQTTLAKINEMPTNVYAMPRFYAISSSIIFDVISDESYACQLRYYKKLDIETDLTNFVLTNYPDLYLYSALLASAPYIENDARIATWASLLDNAIVNTIKSDGRSRGKTMLVADAGLLMRSKTDIFTGV